jgi:hypothetical protein
METLERLGDVTARHREIVGVADAVRWLVALRSADGSAHRAANAFLTRWPRTLAAPVVRKALDDGLLTKATVAAATTTDAAWAGALARPAWLEPLVNAMQRDSILQRVPGFVRVPLGVPVPFSSDAPTLQWVGENAPKPVSALPIGEARLVPSKGAGIVILSDELMRTSDGAERVISSILITASTTFVDGAFLSTAAAVPGVNPAGILNGVVAVAPGANLDASIAALTAQFFAQRPGALLPTFLLGPGSAATIAGTGTHEGVSATGSGVLKGIPAYVTSGAGANVVLVDAAAVIYDDAGAEIDFSRYASIEMSDAPTTPSATVLHDLWSHNQTGVRIDRFVTWACEPTAVAYTVLP